MTEGRMHPVYIVTTLLCLFVLTDAGHPLKILGLFPHVAISHYKFFHPIMRGLAEAGHDVTVISNFPDKSPPVRYRDIPLINPETKKPFDDLTNAIEFEDNNWTHIKNFLWLNNIGKLACNITLRSDALAQVLREKTRYDVILVEAFNSECMWGIGYVLKAPIIALSSCSLMPWHYDSFGVPLIPSFMPLIFLEHSHDMNFIERASNWMYFHLFNFLYKQISQPSIDALIRHKFGHDMPSVGDIVKETSLVLTNTHFSLNGVKPLPPSVVEVSGVHIQKAKALPVEIQRWLDNAEHGAIIISWGSMLRASSLPAEKRDGLLKALQRLKLRAILKWENETLPNKPDNVLFSDWIPQRDALCHPNVKVFMGHGGLMGTTEAVHCGVPMVLTPVYGDQHLNAAAVRSRGMGVILHYEDMSENTIMKSIKKVLEKSYSDNAKAVAHSYNHRPMTAMQTSIWWVEYIAHTEGAPLIRSTSVYMSPFSYYSLDVYLLLSIPLAAIVALVYWLVRTICSKRLKKQKEKDN